MTAHPEVGSTVDRTEETAQRRVSSRRSSDQALTRSFHNGFGHLPQRVDFENSLHLGEDPIQQAKVPARNSDDGRDGIFSPRLCR